MELSILREYVTLSQTLNYTKTAEILHLAQPTLSKHIVSLEKELGCNLFHRDRRRVELTESGTVFVAAAMQMLDTFDEALIRIGELESSDPLRINGVLGDSTISSIMSIASMLLDKDGFQPPVYGGASKETALDQLMSGEIDIAITYIDINALHDLGLAYIPLTRSQFVAMMNLDCPLASLKQLSIDDLRNYRFVKFADNYSRPGWTTIEQVCQDHGFSPRTRTILGRNSMNYLSVPLENDDIIILQQSMSQLRFLSDFSRVAVIPVTDDDAVFKLYAVYHESDEERVRPMLSAFSQARKVIIGHGKDSPLVESD